MKKVTKIQLDWLAWILIDGREWLSNYIEAPQNLRRMMTVLHNREYDSITQLLLNHLLEKFNKDEEMKRKWEEDRAWDRANGLR